MVINFEAFKENRELQIEPTLVDVTLTSDQVTSFYGLSEYDWRSDQYD